MIKKSKTLLTVVDAAEKIGVARQILEGWIREGKVKKVLQIGEGKRKRFFLYRTEVEKIIDARQDKKL